MKLPYIDQRGFWFGGRAPSKLPRKLKKRLKKQIAETKLPWMRVWYSKRFGWCAKLLPHKIPFWLYRFQLQAIVQQSTSTAATLEVDWYKFSQAAKGD